ncbi:HWE histidine kinase domain-containing protein [Novosphingobium panipatense]
MMHELDHRVKNTLAMVLSICGRTLAGSDSLEEFRLRFTRRIQALAATHSLLADASWAGIDLAALIETELAPYVSAAGLTWLFRSWNGQWLRMWQSHSALSCMNWQRTR